MKRIFKHRPSPALGVALLALFVALGGTGYALTITGKSVKNGSLTGKDIKANSLTGKQIREGRLAKVKAARVADRLATRAAAAVTTKGFVGQDVNLKPLANNPVPIGSLKGLPAGGYVLQGKVVIANRAGNPLRVRCFMRAGESTDESTLTLAPGNGASGQATGTLSFLLQHFAQAPFEASMTCQVEGSAGLNLFVDPPFVVASNAKIAAIRLDQIEAKTF